LRIASTFAGLASMPRCPTMKRRSNPEGTPKMHLVRLSFHWNSCRSGRPCVVRGLVDGRFLV
jgi:hypothetical protein